MISWVKYLLLAGALQGFVFAFALIRIKEPKSKLANTIFGLLLFIVSVFMLISSQSDWIGQLSPKLILLSYVLIFTYCPLYYLFAEAIIVNPFKWKRSHLILVLPSLVFFVGWLRYAFMSIQQMAEIFSRKAYYDLIAADAFAISINFYLIWRTWRLVSSRNQKGNLIFPNRDAFIIPTIALVVANLCWVLMILTGLGYPIIQLSPQPDILYLSMSFLMLLFGYFLVLRTELFSVQAIAKPTRYQNVNFEDEQCQSLRSEIINLLATNQCYKDPEFNLADLAELTGIDKVRLSYTINTYMNTNFYSLINKYRVEEFIRLMESGHYENYNLLGIASEAGFSSKSTFYKAFKELKGQSPKEFFASLPVEVKK